ncbi:hypothetical protein AB1Y20_002569 [Prymnesium parvum]|uniref:Transmembrane protein 242 n=1 Tax=Prymnesium parvum TaxID=97485 RepID=A0AB34JBF5_PRYPA
MEGGQGDNAAAPPPPSSVVPGAIAFGVAGAMAFGFGAGFGARSYTSSAAYKELIEKFPDAPTAEAEAFARTGARRSLAAGTVLAGMMGAGAVLFARANGVHSAADFAEEIKKWLPTKAAIESQVAPRIEPLQRSLSASLQTARDAAKKQFKESEMGRGLIAKAENASKRPEEPWEKDLVSKLENEAKNDK